MSPTELPNTYYTILGEPGQRLHSGCLYTFFPALWSVALGWTRGHRTAAPLGPLGTRRHHCPHLGLLCAPVASCSLPHHIKATGGLGSGVSPSVCAPRCHLALARPTQAAHPVLDRPRALSVGVGVDPSVAWGWMGANDTAVCGSQEPRVRGDDEGPEHRRYVGGLGQQAEHPTCQPALPALPSRLIQSPAASHTPPATTSGQATPHTWVSTAASSLQPRGFHTACYSLACS